MARVRRARCVLARGSCGGIGNGQSVSTTSRSAHHPSRPRQRPGLDRHRPRERHRGAQLETPARDHARSPAETVHDPPGSRSSRRPAAPASRRGRLRPLCTTTGLRIRRASATAGRGTRGLLRVARRQIRGRVEPGLAMATTRGADAQFATREPLAEARRRACRRRPRPVPAVRRRPARDVVLYLRGKLSLGLSRAFNAGPAGPRVTPPPLDEVIQGGPNAARAVAPARGAIQPGAPGGGGALPERAPNPVRAPGLRHQSAIRHAGA